MSASCQHVNFALMNRLPNWVKDFYSAPYYYHPSVLEDFRMEVDPYRFAGGFAWICRKCGSPTFVIEGWGELTKSVVCRAVFCPFCFVGYRAPDTELMWVRILLDWELPKPKIESKETLRLVH